MSGGSDERSSDGGVRRGLGGGVVCREICTDSISAPMCLFCMYYAGGSLLQSQNWSLLITGLC
jgi:hypothetical protein